MSYITTYTGNHFDPINPDPELINIVDIAHALPMICRGNGQVSTFWSVGEHCIRVIEVHFCMMRVSVTCQTCRVR